MKDDQFKTPYSPQSLITLFLYNVFYDELDKAVKSNDKQLDYLTKLNQLGPFAYALNLALSQGCISQEKRQDFIPIGKTEGQSGPLGMFSQCHLLFKGAVIKENTIFAWHTEIGEHVRLPGVTVCQMSLLRSLDHALFSGTGN